MEPLTQARLKELLHYSPETGVFIWRVGRKMAGKIAGSPNSWGYTVIGIEGRNRRAHRLAWLYVHGIPPNGQIDHINGVRDDNRISNLRVCVQVQNCWNAKKQKTNKTGFRGVCFNEKTKRFRAQINVFGTKIYLGEYDSPEQASAVYKEKARDLHGEFYREGA
jgi:hypothetical protein